jgi:hypothetical protein
VAPSRFAYQPPNSRSYLIAPLAALASRGSRFPAAYFVVARRRKACRLAPPQHGGARSVDRPGKPCVWRVSDLRATAGSRPRGRSGPGVLSRFWCLVCRRCFWLRCRSFRSRLGSGLISRCRGWFLRWFLRRSPLLLIRIRTLLGPALADLLERRPVATGEGITRNQLNGCQRDCGNAEYGQSCDYDTLQFRLGR